MPIFLHVSYVVSLSYAKKTFQNFTSDTLAEIVIWNPYDENDYLVKAHF